jgi:polyferredoxin
VEACVTGSRLPKWRRATQIIFLLLFLVLLMFTSLRGVPGATSDIHLGAPVRLFFEWDPLVAVGNALASHALYRGLVWSLIILLPTLFLGRFFCGWICPMGTLQHFVGNMPSESKHGRQTVADDQICSADRGAGGRGVWVDGDRMARSL